MADDNSEVLCPVIAEEQIIISEQNVNALSLSNYGRSVGTEVKVTCLSSTRGITGGNDTLICQSDGLWSGVIPTCVDKRLLDQTDLLTTTTKQGISSSSSSYSYEMLPYIVGLGILGLACLLLIVILSYTLLGRKRSHTETNSTIFEGSRSSKTTEESQMDFWIEMPGSRNFQCHELAQSRDSMVDIVRYTHLHPDWSGY